VFRRLTRERYLTDSELKRFMETVRTRRHKNQPRDHAFFALLANTGIRPSEARALTRDDVHLGGREPWIRVRRLKKKRPTSDDLQIPQGLATTLCAYLSYLPVTENSLFRITLRQAARLFQLYRKRAHVHRCPMYALRHTAATRIYRATRDIKIVQAVLGHETPDVSAIYAHIPRSLLVETADATTPIV